MREIWEFFEHLDEMVYVSDLDTYHLIYMNKHLRDALGLPDHQAYQQQTCYKLLQGSDTPCTFCTNSKLKPGSFLSWVHKNPVMNKRFLIKDSIIHANGKDYRMEVAIDIDSEVMCNSPYFYARSEYIINECLQQTFRHVNPEDSIQSILAYIGSVFSCDRAYIFEIDHRSKCTNNTYEWCAEDATPQKEVLQNVPLSGVDWWLSCFEQDQITVIADLESIRTEHPETYAVLKPQGIVSLAVGPIKAAGRTIGFLGVDNPNIQMLELIKPLLNVIGYFVSALLKRRDLIQRLWVLSYRDQLTGALNRHALVDRYGHITAKTMGVLYCDITGLKLVNDASGHEAGDQMILHCYRLIHDAVKGELIYRIGGDEFVALVPNCTQEAFNQLVNHLKLNIRKGPHHLAVGYAWSDQQPVDLDHLVTLADHAMYEDKRAYYKYHPHLNRRKPMIPQELLIHPDAIAQSESPLQTFLQTAYCDVEGLFQSITQKNDSSYFYMGDFQKDLYYISDNMRDHYGFQHNLVHGLLQAWTQRISTPEYRDLFWQDISRMLREKRTIHNLRYRVRDAAGNEQWISCYGILRWNEDQTKPVFFSGRITHQDKTFVVDPITNFPREYASFELLEDVQRSPEKTYIIGFSINGFTEINNTKGRAYGDRLLERIASHLVQQLSDTMTFFRLEGMRCMAVVNPVCVSCEEDVKTLVEQIRAIVKGCYEERGLWVQNVCSVGVIECPRPDFKPEDLIQNLLSLIRAARQDTSHTYLDCSSQTLQQIRHVSDMTMALHQDVHNGMEHFRVVVQPVVSTQTGKPIGGEVLLRWSLEGQDISPGIFIPIMEKENLILLAGRWVFEQAVCTCARLHAYDPSFYLTFNVSLHQLNDLELLGYMKQVLEKYRLDGSSLVAELTESCLDEQPELLASFSDGCHQLGIRMALDDFGSGYSSLRMLLQYPSNIVKLDRSLVLEATESEQKLDFVRCIVLACHQFGKRVCVEGVELANQNEMILATGCDMIQGYYYYRPMELSALYRLLSEE